jgi:nucleotide-binding universal stress UspA family protein
MEDLLYLQDIRDGSKATADDYLRQRARVLQAMGIRVTTEAQFGRPSEVILEYAKRRRPDLIAMATHGRSGLRRVVLGSVATHILYDAACPLLLIRPWDETARPVATLTDIIVTLDTSALAEAVLPIAQHLATSLRLNVKLVTALPRPSQLYAGAQLMTYPVDILRRAENEFSDYLRNVAGRLQQDGLNAGWQVLHGDAGNAIVGYARELPNNLIAMSTHGRSGLGRWVLGSVTDKVVRSSGSPVLVVRPQRP